MTDPEWTERITPGAFKNMLPKDVPLHMEGGPVIGTATTRKDGTVECTVTDEAWVERLGYSTFIFGGFQ